MSTDTPKDAPKGDRIAKVLARAGVASRRDAERMIEAGRVFMNGTKVERAALNVLPSDNITVDGKPISEWKSMASSRPATWYSFQDLHRSSRRLTRRVRSIRGPRSQHCPSAQNCQAQT